MYQHILLPHDGSDLSDEAAQHGIAFAKSIAAKLTLVHVVAHRNIVIDEARDSGLTRKLEQDLEQTATSKAREMLFKVEARARAQGVVCDSVVVVGDNPYREVIDQARNLSCDLIVMASHGRRGLEGLLLGSETAKLLTHCKIPVLVVRHR